MTICFSPLQVEVCYTSSHVHIVTCSHTHTFSFSLLHIFTSTFLRIFTSPYLHIFTSSYLHIFTSSHLHIFTSSHLARLHIFSSSHLHIFTSSLSVSCHLSRSLSFFFFSLLRPQAVPTRRHDMATLPNEMRFAFPKLMFFFAILRLQQQTFRTKFESQKLMFFCEFGWSGGNLSHETRFEC